MFYNMDIALINVLDNSTVNMFVRSVFYNIDVALIYKLELPGNLLRWNMFSKILIHLVESSRNL